MPGKIVATIGRSNPKVQGMCANWVVVNGERIRQRTARERSVYAERGGRCSLMCKGGECALEGPPDADAEALVRMWKLCGKSSRLCWPKSGGVDEQDAVTVFVFELLDETEAA